jgi:hypothetical protein
MHTGIFEAVEVESPLTRILGVPAANICVFCEMG